MAWTRKELAEALLLLWELRLCCGSHHRIGMNSRREHAGLADESWLRTSADPKPCLRLELLALSVCAAVGAPLRWDPKRVAG